MRLWVSQDDISDLQKLAKATGLPQVEIMTRILSAGVRCVVLNGYKLTLPLRFRIVEPEGFVSEGDTERMILEDAPHRVTATKK